MIDAAINTLLKANGPVSALVAARIYPLRVPQSETLPAIAIQRTKDEELQTLGGPIGPAEGHVVITAWADTALAAKALGDTIVEELRGFRGIVGNYRFQGIFVRSIRDDDAQPDPGADTTVYGTTIECDVFAEMRHRPRH